MTWIIFSITPATLFPEKTRLQDVISALRQTYCRSIGIEYMHLQDPHERTWLQERMEPSRNTPRISREEKLQILNKLCQAYLFERLLHTRYIGQKRFSIEGAEIIVPMLDTLIRIAVGAGAVTKSSWGWRTADGSIYRSMF